MKAVKTVVIGIVVIVAVVVGLVLSCPDEESFKRWARKSLEPEAGSVVEQAKGKALSTQAKWTADYRSHVLWATVDAYQGGSRHRYVGVAGIWFQWDGE